MTAAELMAELRSTLHQPPPLPGGGQTALRHRSLMATGRQNLSLARLAEAHWDAVAILAEAGREPMPGAVYGVWAAEAPGHQLRLVPSRQGFRISGAKMFCSGAGLVDRALVTAAAPEHRLVEIDLVAHGGTISYDRSAWKTPVFEETQTATVTFHETPVTEGALIGAPDWYLARPGFWHGACGPAACWAGGAAGLLDFALEQARESPHTLAHLGAMAASVWALQAYLDCAGNEIDAHPGDGDAARIRALTVRHLVEQACTDVLRRLPRAYGPYPLALHEGVAARYHELDLYLRQSHAERDLEGLGRDLRAAIARRDPSM